MTIKGKTLVDYPDLLKEWHPAKNDNIKPQDVATGSNKQIWWKCLIAPDHGEWQAAPYTRIKGYGRCPCCTRRKAAPSNCLTTTHPQIAAQWHQTKNGDLTPNGIIAGSHKEVWWQCPVASDHEWMASVDCRTRNKSNCPCCNGKGTGKKIVLSNCLATTHPKIIAQWHLTKNKNLTPNDVCAGSHKEVWWKCPVALDHEWKATPHARTGVNQTDCPCCSGHKVVLSNCLAITHPNLVIEWDQAKNGKATPYDVTAGNHRKKYWWKCSTNPDHKWQTVVAHRTRGGGCPFCNESKGEKAIREYLVEHHIPHKSQWGRGKVGLSKGYRFDFAVNRLGQFWLIEYQGKQHYYPHSFGSKQNMAKYRMFIDGLKRDEYKRRWANERHKNILEIPYWDKDRIKDILDDFFAGKQLVISEMPEIVKKFEPMRQKILAKILLS